MTKEPDALERIADALEELVPILARLGSAAPALERAAKTVPGKEERVEEMFLAAILVNSGQVASVAEAKIWARRLLSEPDTERLRESIRKSFREPGDRPSPP